MTIEELRRLQAAATPGPWLHHAHGGSVRFCDGAHDSEDGCSDIGESESLGISRDQAVANTAFIVAACNALPALLEAAEALGTLVDRAGLYADEDDHGNWDGALSDAIAGARATLEKLR
jgi:hypothetical protein